MCVSVKKFSFLNIMETNFLEHYNISVEGQSISILHTFIHTKKHKGVLFDKDERVS